MLTIGFFGFSLACDVRLFEHSHTTAAPSAKCTIHEGKSFNNMDNRSMHGEACPGNGQLSKVTRRGMCYVDIWHETNYGGTHERLWGSFPDQAHNTLVKGPLTNDVAKSIRVYKAWCPSATKKYPVMGYCKKCRVTLAEHKPTSTTNGLGSYKEMGRWCERGDGYKTRSFSANGGCPGRNEISYIKIEGNCDMKVYSKRYYKGHVWHLKGPGTFDATFQSDQHYENDEIESIKFYLAGRRRREATESNRVILVMSEEEKERLLRHEPHQQLAEEDERLAAYDLERETGVFREEERMAADPLHLEERETGVFREEERVAADRLFDLEEPAARAGLLERVLDYISTGAVYTDEKED